MKFLIFHMRNETNFLECQETVNQRAQPYISLDKIEEKCEEIYSSDDWHHGTDWIEIHPVAEEIING